MKIKSFIAPALFIPAVCFFAGCQKEGMHPSDGSVNSTLQTATVDKTAPKEHKLKGEFTTGYYSFVPDMAAGYVAPNPAPGWYPGGATDGHVNLLGKCQSMVNMYTSFDPSGLQGTAASLNLFFADKLKTMGITLPDPVAILIYDQQGNSIWARGIGTIPVTPVSATHVTFSGKNAEILGGTGKFVNATGSFAFSGYFNPQSTTEVGFEITDGTIVY